MPNAPFIALEVHDASLWEPSRILPMVDKMEAWGYNALVLHQNDLLDACTQLGLTANYGVSDLRLKKVRNNAAWLNRLTERLAKFNARLFLEIKEPSFHDYALEYVPGLLGSDGLPDPTRPDWVGFCRAKTQDLLARVPELGGLIINLSSPESRVSLPDFVVGEQAMTDTTQWFTQMIDAFQGPLGDAGKTLYVRDFSYTTDMQSDVLGAVETFNGKVGASLKITAHDYFPKFPENPAAASVKVPLIFEFEAFGEHTGWGVIPNCRVGEFRERAKGYREKGASGLLMRVSWEAITGANAFDSLSAVNVFALPRLAAEDCDEVELVSLWLIESFGLQTDLAGQAARLMLESWKIPAASYWHGKVFPRHSCLPSTWQEGWLSMQTSGMGRRDRELGILPDDPMLSEAARVKLFEEKEQATGTAYQLAREAKGLSEKLPPALASIFSAFDWLPMFARQFELASKATFFAARRQAGDATELALLATELTNLRGEIAAKLADMPEDANHHAHVLFDPTQIDRFVSSLAD